MPSIVAGVLRVEYHDYPGDGVPVILLHGFPYDVQAYAEVAPLLAAAGHRVIVPYLRGYGSTRFLSAQTPRSGQQAALAHDLLALMDALAIPRALLGGYDWGGRAACIVAALWPDRAAGLATCNGYNLQDIPRSGQPAPPEDEHRMWYQYYLHGERGRAGLSANRREFCRLLWRLWSPNWDFDEATFERSAPSFDNPDFVDVVVHSYRHRYALVEGDPALEATEIRLREQPAIGVPAIALDGTGDGVVRGAGGLDHAHHFTGCYEHREIPLVGHNLPQEAPQAFARAILDLA
jgi:pimeloyl-ACP methyl ester carboxylesterase